MVGVFLSASIFLTTPAPLDMPRASAYLVAARERSASGEARRLEDRFVRNDLWLASVSLGRWADEQMRVFSLFRLDTQVPAVGGEETISRSEYAKTKVALGRRDEAKRRDAIAALSPVPIFQKGRSPRQLPRGFAEVEYWHEPTNLTTMVCAFRPKKCEWWYMAVWELDDGDDIFQRMETFEEVFLVKEFGKFREKMEADGKCAAASGEREMLRHDAHWSVAPYDSWRWTDSPAYTVLDDLTRCRGFVATLTNAIPALFGSYAKTVPTSLDGTNVLCVARIYDNREEYLDALEVDGNEDMAWSAAYWSPLRRELVAYLPDVGEGQLLKTFRHEMFHQYLSYACGMTSASPWFNEGYAQYFEDTESTDWELDGVMSEEVLEKLGEMLPGVMAMGYRAFYSGSDEERRLKYRLAWSLAVFIEKGAPKVRFRPFKDLKRDYVEALIETEDMRKATAAAFGGDVGPGGAGGAGGEKLKLFVREWKKYWRERGR